MYSICRTLTNENNCVLIGHGPIITQNVARNTFRDTLVGSTLFVVYLKDI